MHMRTRAGWPALTLVAALTALAALGCHPGGFDELEELDVVVTFHDESVDFGAFHTFALDETVHDLALLEDPDGEPSLDHEYDEFIFDRIAEEMQARGYFRVDTTEVHDLRLGVAGSTMEGTAIYAYLPWWGYSPGYWYPAWDSVDFTRGTMIVFMADWAGRDDVDGEVDPIWIGTLDGVLEDSSANMEDRIDRGIAQMFIQSPYLETDADKARTGEVSP